MSAQLKTVLLTVLTLSAFVIALVELSGVSSTALFNKYNISVGQPHNDAQQLTPVINEVGNSETAARQEKVQNMPKTQLEFDETKFNFGNIKEGSVVKHAFKFRNIGTAPLLISKVEVSCGCTVPSFPKEPIAPGAGGEIILQFDSHSRNGHQEKNAIVFSNSQLEKMSIGFVAEVE